MRTPSAIAAFVTALALPSSAHAFELLSTTATVGAPTRLRFEVGGQLYTRARARHPDGAETTWDFDLTRARLKTTFSWGDWLRIDIEPDFGGANADIADVFLQIEPVEDFDIRIGQTKTPFGSLEIESRWRLPSLSRGLVSDVVADRLAFGRRKFGARIRWRGKKIALKPRVEVGTFGRQGDDITDDLVAHVSVRVIKGLRVALSGYSRDGARTDGGRGNVVALYGWYDRKGLYAIAEAQLGRAVLLSANGQMTGVDATFFSARAVAAYRLKFLHDFAVEPFLAGDLLDPNADTRDDISVAFRLGANFHWMKRLRVGAEWGRQTGQIGAVTSPGSTLLVFVGTSLE